MRRDGSWPDSATSLSDWNSRTMTPGIRVTKRTSLITGFDIVPGSISAATAVLGAPAP